MDCGLDIDIHDDASFLEVDNEYVATSIERPSGVSIGLEMICLYVYMILGT